MLNAKENWLEAINFGKPDYVPMGNENIWYSILFDNSIKKENWTDLWGIDWKVEMKGTSPFPKGNPLSDIRNLDNYHFPSASELIINMDSLNKSKTIDRSTKVISGNFTYLLFERAWALMGMESFFEAIYEYPEELRFILHKIAEFTKDGFDRLIECGVESISFSEDLGSQRALMISPKHFEEFFIPEYQYIFETAIKENVMINFHSCGCIDEIAGMIADLGVTELNPIQARANNLRKVKNDTFGKMALSGAIDSQMLIIGTPEEVKEETQRVIEILKPGGGYVCAPDQLMPDMKEENLKALWDTAKALGRY